MVMNVESSAILKRVATLICSMLTIICMGYAVGGAGGYLAGKGRPLAILLGLAGAAVSACASFSVWRSYLKDAEFLNRREKEDE
jgi:hypothetical protein